MLKQLYLLMFLHRPPSETGFAEIPDVMAGFSKTASQADGLWMKGKWLMSHFRRSIF
ncbi:MAG TPA: hypothetical protein PLJ27_12135 [Polyangiaceae bacterium]|nr:hypothetical protein [Polyangiaceae bacterium]